eukprot:Nitzschia sp. Nitz4//scaffold95_size97785//82877//83908//NITZ4_004679-RA/size97785-processed-gene-0.22-mRNA-1//1//CDS//3329560508//5992//frame0
MNTTMPISPTANMTYQPFVKHDGVVLVTKVHGPPHKHLLFQSLCLLHHAYNFKPLYDVIVFTTGDFTQRQKNYLHSMVSPVNLTIVVDNRGLQQEIAALTPERRKNFLAACKVTSPENLTWWSECPGRLAYNWQAEFRGWHLWTHPALAPYKTMMWFDTDAFATKEWTVDPIPLFLRNDLVVLFDNIYGEANRKEVGERIAAAFNVSLKVPGFNATNGHLLRTLGPVENWRDSTVQLIHGFFHITNLDFFRSPVVQRWVEIWIGDGFLQRDFDDQGALTVPAAILAPERSWSLYENGIELELYHHNSLDGRQQSTGFLKVWNNITSMNLVNENMGKCPVTATG